MKVLHLQNYTIGPPLKKSCFQSSGRVRIFVPTDFFFFFFCQFSIFFFFFAKISIIFLPTKKKGWEGFAAARVWP